MGIYCPYYQKKIETTYYLYFKCFYICCFPFDIY